MFTTPNQRERLTFGEALLAVKAVGICCAEWLLSIAFMYRSGHRSDHRRTIRALWLILANRKNKIVNGDFKGWSHGTYFDKSGVTADNWYWSTNDVGRIRQERFGKGEVPVASEASPFYLRWSIKGDSQNYEILQKISNVRTFAGQTVALSFWARQTVGSTTFQTRIFQDFGSGGSPSPLTQAGGSYAKLDVTKSWKRFIQVFTIPKISGKTIGSNGNSYLWVSFQAGSKAVRPARSVASSIGTHREGQT